MGFSKLKTDLKNENIGNFYIFYGVEHYMKNFYIEKIQNQLILGEFASFNLEKFDQFNFTVEDFENAVESYPAMSERKLILVRDVDIFKLKADEKDRLIEVLSDLPEYICIIFDYIAVEYKIDARVKLGKIIKKNASEVEFEFLALPDLKAWLMRRFKTYKLEISTNNLEYLIFSCGMSMTSLSNETLKLSGYSKGTITEEDIDLVCTKAIEAKIFNIADDVMNGKMMKAFDMIDELIMQKNEEFSILAVINSQFQRLYMTKLCLNEGKNNDFIAKTINIKSSYAVNININSAQKLGIFYLRNTTNLCAKAMLEMVSENSDKYEVLKILITKIGGLDVKN